MVTDHIDRLLAALLPKPLRRKATSLLRRIRLRQSLELVNGAARIPAGQQDVIVTALVRNGEEYIPEFMRHYTSLGVRHIALLDNGSTDRTVELASRYPNVTIFRSELPFNTYEPYLRRFIVKQFSGRNWVLNVDVDECFDYPNSDRVPLSGLIRYLNRFGYTVLLVHMLDLLPETGVRWEAGSSPSLSEPGAAESFREQHRLYSIRALNPRPYNQPNIVTNPAMQLYRGGLRGELFGAKGFPLYKHPLFLPSSGATFRHPHLVEGGRLADFTGVLYHYKFSSRFQARVLDAVRHGHYASDSNIYLVYLEAFDKGVVSLSQGAFTRLNGVQDLVDNGFLVVSDQYRQYAAPTYRA